MTDEAVSRSPEPEELLKRAVTYFLSDVHTSMPGRIQEYYPVEQKVDVKPLIKRRVVTEDGEEFLEELPIIPDVPVQFPRNAKFFMTLPLAQGDLVMLQFAERSLDNWLAGTGEDTDPDEFRMHDLTDAVAVPGVYPFSQGIKDIDTKRMTLGHDNGGMQMHFAKDKIEISEGGLSEKHAAIVEHLQSLYEELKAKLDAWEAHTHPVPNAIPLLPGPVLAGPTLLPLGAPSWDSAINSTKVGLPDG